MGEYTAPHVMSIKMEEEERKIEAEDYDELKNTGEINILIEIDQNLWTFLRTFEVGSILSLSELISLATKHSCDQCGEVFFSSTLFQGHLASHHGDQEEKCPLTGFQGDNEDLEMEMDDRLDSPELGLQLPSEEKEQKINISKAAYDIFHPFHPNCGSNAFMHDMDFFGEKAARRENAHAQLVCLCLILWHLGRN